MIYSELFWMIVLIIGIGTFLIRFSLIALSSRIVISKRMKDIFSYIPVAVLPSMVAPAVYFHQGHVNWLMGKERILALLIAALVSFYARSTLATIVSGLLVLYLVSNY